MKRVLLGLVAALLVYGLWQATQAFEAQSDEEPITVFGPWLGEDADAFAASVAGFVDDTGIEVRYTGSLGFDTELRQRVASGSSTLDVAVVPQPGLVDELITSGIALPYSQLAADAVAENFPESALQRHAEGELFSFPYRSNIKSLVWYRPEVFEANGWTPPETLDGITELVQEIETTSDMSPWCFGIFSGDDTGWPATDWVEDLLLRRSGPDAYDEWTDGTRGFGDPDVRAAFDEFRSLVLAGGRSNGGLRVVLQTELRTIAGPLFEPEPGCAMFKQASFATIWFPDDTGIGPDEEVDFFVLPELGSDSPSSLVTGGDQVLRFDSRPEVDLFLEYLASPDGARQWAAAGGYLSARTSVDPNYYQPNDQRLAAVLAGAGTTRFDASDTFPSEYRDLVLDRVTAWVAGTITYDEMASSLDDARPDPTP